MSATAVNIEEELKALKNAMASYKDQMALELGSYKDEVACCRKEIDDLKTKLKESIEANNKKQDRNKDTVMNAMNKDTYTFVFCSKIGSIPALIGVTIAVVQILLYSIFLWDFTTTNEAVKDVSTAVRISQGIAIPVAFLSESEIRTALRSLLAAEGLHEISTAFPDFSSRSFVFANLVMLLQGGLGIVVTMYLILRSDNVFDLLLNFTAVMFISQLDDIAFVVADFGYMGRHSQELAKKMKRVEYPSKNNRDGCKWHTIIYSALLILAFLAYFNTIRYQNRNIGHSKFVKAQFGDEVEPILGLHSGCYELDATTLDNRVFYLPNGKQRPPWGGFRYCAHDDFKTWVYATGTFLDVDSGDDGCDYALRSSEERPSSFDLMDTKRDDWLFGLGSAVTSVQLQPVGEAECKNNILNYCLTLSVTTGVGFGGTGHRQWSSSFSILRNEQDNQVHFYRHPVFVGNETAGEEGAEFVFFTGRRWVMTTAAKILDGTNTTDRSCMNCMKEAVNQFQVGEYWLWKLKKDAIAFVSEAVGQSGDEGNPADLLWYHSRYKVALKSEEYGADYFPSADIARPAEETFECSNFSFVRDCGLGACVDTPEWTDISGDGCSWFESGSRCLDFRFSIPGPDGVSGPDGYTAADACCACGGGSCDYSLTEETGESTGSVTSGGN